MKTEAPDRRLVTYCASAQTIQIRKKQGLGAVDRKMSETKGSPKEEGREKQDLE